MQATGGRDMWQMTSDGLMPGLATPGELAEPRTPTGQAFDVRFLQMMMSRLSRCMDMAEQAASRADEPVVRSLVDTILQTQTAETAPWKRRGALGGCSAAGALTGCRGSADVSAKARPRKPSRLRLATSDALTASVASDPARHAGEGRVADQRRVGVADLSSAGRTVHKDDAAAGTGEHRRRDRGPRPRVAVHPHLAVGHLADPGG